MILLAVCGGPESGDVLPGLAAPVALVVCAGVGGWLAWRHTNPEQRGWTFGGAVVAYLGGVASIFAFEAWPQNEDEALLVALVVLPLAIGLTAHAAGSGFVRTVMAALAGYLVAAASWFGFFWVVLWLTDFCLS